MESKKKKQTQVSFRTLTSLKLADGRSKGMEYKRWKEEGKAKQLVNSLRREEE